MTKRKNPVENPVRTMPGRNGGTLLRGNPSAKPGPGRPRNVLRDCFAGHAVEIAPAVLAIGRGEHVRKTRVRLLDVLRYAECPSCGDALASGAAAKGLAGATITLEAHETPAPADRIKAFDVFAKYGIGVKDELTVVSSDVRARIEQTVQLISSRPHWEADALLAALDLIWGDGA